MVHPLRSTSSREYHSDVTPITLSICILLRQLRPRRESAAREHRIRQGGQEKTIRSSNLTCSAIAGLAITLMSFRAIAQENSHHQYKTNQYDAVGRPTASTTCLHESLEVMVPSSAPQIRIRQTLMLPTALTVPVSYSTPGNGAKVPCLISVCCPMGIAAIRMQLMRVA